MSRGLQSWKDGVQGRTGRIEIDVLDRGIEIDISNLNGDGQMELSSSILERNNLVRRQGGLHQLAATIAASETNQVHMLIQEAQQLYMHHLPAKDIDRDSLSQSQATEQPLGTEDLAVENKNRSEFLSTVQNGPEKEDRISPKCENRKCQSIATNGQLFSGLPVWCAQHQATAMVATMTTTAAGMAKKRRVRGCMSMEVCGAHQDKPLRCTSHVRARPLKQPRVQTTSSNVSIEKDTQRGSGGTEGTGISDTPHVLPTTIPPPAGESVGAIGKQASRSSGVENGAGLSAPPQILPATVESVAGEPAIAIWKETPRSSGRTIVAGLLTSPCLSPPTVAFVAGEPVQATGKDTRRSNGGTKVVEPSGSPGFQPATISSVSGEPIGVQKHESGVSYLVQSPPSGRFLSQKEMKELEVEIKQLKKEHDGLQQRMVSIEIEMARLQGVQKCEIERHQIQNERAAKSCLQLKSQTTMQSLPLRRNIAVQGSLQQGKATACAILRPLIDGYNWRKYNEIIPPGTTSPQVFYGCTNMGCIARKIEEHSPTGHVRHIYEGSHNHLQPRKAMALIRSCRKRKLSYRELEKGRLRVDGQ
ncbi:unnamed protein product [Sphagnum jensenii]|uniref:WRKY domain-containing protein n=1 Tax=Sphagnum jensenii TaxID=128206 RepID=A0ABP0VKV5_9BRYO